ncbi:hypothetical protein WA026_011667 [Henosepilachna vigintioctopunctata]|uniref:Cytochrome P450 n=1 Tax=Henosepilachna vigintioctopunctata TaxID=420089 RepID=A0AAW1TMF4_9CUCU
MVSAISETLLVLITTILFIRLVKYLWSLLNTYRMCSLIPGPPGYPLIGSALDFLDHNRENTLRTLIGYFTAYPKFFKFWMGTEVVIGLSTPEHLEIILNHPKCLEKSIFYDVTKCLVGNGIFSAPVHSWRKNRKSISSTFSGRNLNVFVKNFSDQAKKLTDILTKNIGTKRVDIFPLLSACNVDILCETAMGVIMNAQTSDDHFGKWIASAEEIISIRMTNPWYYTNFMFSLTTKNKILKKCVAAMKGFTNKLVTEKKQTFDKKMMDLNNGILVEDENSSHKILLDVLLQQKNEMKLTDEEVYDEVNTFFAAGPDTTACALAFCLMTLGIYPEIQQRVYEELVDVLGTEREVTAEDLPHLHYLDKVIKETLRIFPTAPIFSRSPTANIDINDAVIPAGSIILLCPLFTHRNPKYWKNPLTFDPERFSSTEVSKRHPYSYFPFSLGPRGCVGYKFANMAMKTVIATVLRKLIIKSEYQSVEEVRLQLSFLLKPCQGFKVSLQIRE